MRENVRTADGAAIQASPPSHAPPVNEDSPGNDVSRVGNGRSSAGRHVVQFYEDDDFLVESLANHIGTGLSAGEGALVIATEAHRAALEARLLRQGIDMETARSRGQYVALDAAETLSDFMPNGRLDIEKSAETIRSMVRRCGEGRPGVRVFGEMVALLWSRGNDRLVVELESLWNQSLCGHNFSLFCAYPIHAFSDSSKAEVFTNICHAHSHVIPAESCTTTSGGEQERARAIALLQQKAASLEREIAERQRAEAELIKDMNERKRTEKALAQAVRQQSELYRFVERRHRARSFEEIHQAALEAILGALECDRAAILLCDDSGAMRFVASIGLSEEYRRAVEGHSPWRVHDPNPQPVCIPDVAAADLDSRLRDIVLQEGVRAVAFTPLIIDDRLGGKFMTYYNAPHAFGSDELELGLSIARQLALGIERKRAEEELRSREQQIRQLLSLMPAAVYTCDAQGRITFFNKRAAELWGREPRLLDDDDKFCGAFELFYPNGKPLPLTSTPMAFAVREGRSTRNGEVMIGRPDGSRVVASVNIDPMYDASGKPCGAINVLQDITERKGAEQRLATQYRISRILVEAASIADAAPAVLRTICEDTGWEFGALWLVDEKAERLHCIELWKAANLNAADFERITRETTFAPGIGLPGRVWVCAQPVHVEDVLQDPNFPRAASAARGGLCAAAAFPLRIENRVIGVIEFFSRTSRPVEPDFVQRANAVGNQVGQFLERKRAEDAIRRARDELEMRVQERTASLKEAVAQMEEFSYTVSHDLRAPVRAMHSYASVVLEDYGDRLDENGREYLDRIIRGGKRMDLLIQDILTYSRLSRREVQLGPVSLDKLVREIVQQYPNMQPSACTLCIADSLDAVIGHEPSLTQAISNLLSNATKFVSPHTTPKVRIRTERRGDQVRLWIEDNGIGIRPEHQHRLFGLFERIHPEQSFEGTGIGLAIVRKAVERMGGRVGVESDGLTGSNFWIQLPAANTQ